MVGTGMQALHNLRVREIAAQYQARGYRVVDPKVEAIPPFLRDFTPDLIAEGSEESVVVDVKTVGKVSPDYWYNLASAVRQHPGWRLELVALDPADEQPTAKATRADVRKMLREAISLSRQHKQAAYLLLWSAVEAAMRLLIEKFEVEIPDDFTGTLITRLYTDSLMDREDFDLLNASLTKRNAVSHGFRVDVTAEDISALEAVTERLLKE